MNNLLQNINENTTFYIWSNGNSHKDLTDYKKSLDKLKLNDNIVNVFINTCVPLQTETKIFDSSTNILICCACSEQNSKVCFFGYDEAKKYRNVLSNLLIYDNGNIRMIDINNLSAKKITNLEWKNDKLFYILDRSFLKTYKTNTKYKETTGFAAYFFIKQFFNTDKIVLCNFGIKDKRFEKTKAIHGIIYEDQYFNDHHVERLFV